jgi:phage terminase large subunit-like protein
LSHSEHAEAGSVAARDLGVRRPGRRRDTGTTYENRANLAPGFFQSIVSRYEGTRLGRQELEAELLTDTPGARWSWQTLENCRRERAPDDLQRIVIAIDPAVSSREGSDETGIIVAGKDGRGRGHVLADLSGRYSPIEWARIAIGAYYEHSADRIVAEVNQGGEMVEATLRTIDPNVSYSAVHASRGKYTRAEPVAALYEQGKVHHVGTFPKLEDQMTSYIPDIDRDKMGSPDRLDALVWALTELLVTAEPYVGLMQYYESQRAAMSASCDRSSINCLKTRITVVFGARVEHS